MDRGGRIVRAQLAALQPFGFRPYHPSPCPTRICDEWDGLQISDSNALVFFLNDFGWYMFALRDKDNIVVSRRPFEISICYDTWYFLASCLELILLCRVFVQLELGARRQKACLRRWNGCGPTQRWPEVGGIRIWFSTSKVRLRGALAVLLHGFAGLLRKAMGTPMLMLSVLFI